MPTATATRSAPTFLARGAKAALVALLLLSPLAVVPLAIETAPRVADPGPPDALTAERTQAVVARLKAVVDDDGVPGSFAIDEDELNAVLAAAQRLVPGVVGRAGVAGDTATLDLSAGAPLLPRGLWANLHLGLAASSDGLRLTSARIGRLPIPPWLALEAVRLALDRKLGDGLGSDLLASVAAVEIDPPEVRVALDFAEVGGPAFFERLRARIIEAAGTTARERVYVQAWQLDQRLRRGGLPRSGSALPWIEQVIRVAAQPRDAAVDREELRAAFYALALVCGDPDFGDTIALGWNDRMRSAARGCARTTLGGREDLRKHFVISAGLYAASAGKAAFGMGELKELLDSNPGGSGFSFDDMAADLAGVRFAAAFLDAPPEAWRGMLAGIADEADVMPATEGLPSGMSEAAFRERFGSVDSAAYAATVAEIRRRVDALPFYVGDGAR